MTFQQNNAIINTDAHVIKKGGGYMFMVFSRREGKGDIKEVENKIIVRYLLFDNLLKDLGDYVFYSFVRDNPSLYRNRRVLRREFKGSVGRLDDYISRLRSFIRDDLARLCQFEEELIDAYFDQGAVYRYDGEDPYDLINDKEKTIRAFCSDNEKMVDELKERRDLKLIKSFRNITADSIELAKTDENIQLRSAGFMMKYHKSDLLLQGILKGVI